MKTFTLIWLGQLISSVGSGLTSFGIGVWIYQTTESATQYSLLMFCMIVPRLAMAPLAGVFVDRWDRRSTMILSDGGSGLCILALGLMVWTGRVEVWHLYLAAVGSSIFGAFQWPAFSAATTLLVAKRDLSRAGGMTQMGQAASQIVAPFVAGLVIGKIGLSGLVLIDSITFLPALGTLLMARVPKPEVSPVGAASRGSFRHEMTVGWKFILSRPGLFSLLLLHATTNFFLGMVQLLITPFMLSFASVEELGRTLSIASLGMLVGGLAMSVWRGPRRRMDGILGARLVQGLLLLLAGLQPAAWAVAVIGFIFLFALPVVYSSTQAIWQNLVPPDIQGRVFAARQVVALSTPPLAFLAGGPLAEFVLEPALAPGGTLAGSVGRVIGIGEGRGIAFLFVILGFMSILAVALASRFRQLRFLEDEIPDLSGSEAEPEAIPGDS